MSGGSGDGHGNKEDISENSSNDLGDCTSDNDTTQYFDPPIENF